MRWTKKNAQERIYIFSFMVSLIAIGLLYICNFWIFKSDNGLNYGLNRILAYVAPLIFVFVVCLFSGNISKIEFHKKGIVTGVLLGWLIIANGVYGFVSSYVSFDKSSISFPSMKKIILFTVVMLLVGILEEVLCRGVILNNMLNKWGYTKTGIIKSVILSSLIFGVAHLVNLIVFPTLIMATVTQVIYNFLTGVLFASIYLRCKNIWAVVVLHAIYDWLAMVSDIYHTVAAPGAPVDTSVVSGLITSMLYIPFALVGFFLLRKVFYEYMSKSEIDTKSV
ncbi:CPBP family intramembrane metalloprotease [Clostridium estertheticum]|uniref:CPBP family intramembrane glutamic endopeptidase n=1 Tax=Clostridium estertheticum TaxID=238834 RepID=UPI0013EE8F9A|nr:type II CAAX endopeptidase family protein [Clostridium estertheticum]MBZ9607372.1 CPBP family intramembrane metalloprotease [Clostridium estertheticum]